MSRRTSTTLSLSCALALLGCAESLKDQLADQSVTPDAETPAPGEDASPGAGDVVTTVIDASNQQSSYYFDLDTGRGVADGAGWDLSFRRFHVQMNGGVSGERGVQALIAEDADFDELVEAPEQGYSSDEPDGEGDEDSDPDNIFNNGERDWYDYDVETHTLTSKKLSYVVQSSEGSFFKLIIDDYYDGAGSPAILTLRWAALAGSETPQERDAGGDEPIAAGDAGAGAEPDAAPEGAFQVEAASGSDWVYATLSGEIVTPDDPAQSLDWDLAFKRTELRTNSGDSGPGHGGAKLEERELSFDEIQAADTFGFSTDVVRNSGAPGATASSQNPVLAGWYDYNPQTHAASPGDRSYIVRSARGEHAKLRIFAFEDGTYTLLVEPIARTRAVREVEADASSAETWTYLSLRDGALVAVESPESDTRWDVGISRTNFRTNGGSSGGALGGAAEASVTELSALSDPGETFTTDSSVSSGAPGSVPVSANPVLSAWYDYDGQTHLVSPRPAVFVVRTADGSFGALQVLAYASGKYTLAITFAGAGAPRFE